MTRSEFVERTGFEPLPFEYEKIEDAYYTFNGDMAAFCKAFVESGGEKKLYQARAAEIERLNGKILEMDRDVWKTSESYERRLADLEAQLNDLQKKPQTEESGTMGNGCSYIIYISTDPDKVYALHRPMMDLAAAHPGWHWHISTVQVLKDCRIPELYHGGRYWATLVEHNNGDWGKAPTYELHCI